MIIANGNSLDVTVNDCIPSKTSPLYHKNVQYRSVVSVVARNIDSLISILNSVLGIGF